MAHLTVAVLGDVGRSPRMQFHALSWQSHHRPVHLVGLAGEPPSPELSVISISDTRFPGPWIVAAPVRALRNALALFWHLARLETDVLLVQNPPSIPTLLVAFLASSINGSAVCIDWHNLGFKMLEHGGRAPSWLVHLARLYEGFFARQADLNFCVTRALQQWLSDKFGVEAAVLYDRPHAEFSPLPSETKVSVRSSLVRTEWLQDANTALLVSATSWTADEDFELLLQGLVLYAAVARTNSHLPRVVVVITGKGPLKAHYASRIAQLQASFQDKVQVQQAWLAASDYPRLIAAADLGVSMHTSTSGLDLPMKILDFFGAGIPVLAAHFACIGELVGPANGRLFSSSKDFSQQLCSLLLDFPKPLATAVFPPRLESWDSNWNQVAWPKLGNIRASRKRVWAWRLVLLLLLSSCLLGTLLLAAQLLSGWKED